MISAIIPTYRNPAYLDLCLRSATENRQNEDTEIIVIVDGYPEESAEVVAKYGGIRVLDLPQNMGMQYALNIGVMNATNEWVFIMNDDNVFGGEWDAQFEDLLEGHFTKLGDITSAEDWVFTINQVEPVAGIYNFLVQDFGRTAKTFDYDAWMAFEPKAAHFQFSEGGRIFPFLITKRWYQTLGGFDTFYKSPFWCDHDFWLKAELSNQLKFVRWHGSHLYHFGSIATKNREDAESELFKKSEAPAAQTFMYKWGFIPNIVESSQLRGNSKLPLDKSVKGIRFK